MLSYDDRQLIERIKEIKTIIERQPGREHYVCVHAMCAAYEQSIKEMVKMHIGEHYTMESFLKKKWHMHESSDLSPVVANSYRVCMLNNMIRMVKSGEYRG